jgi:DNA-binding transcriptional LysR family regulator
MPSSPLDLATLRVVVLAADLGSISAASDRLRLAVAAASTRITALEDTLSFRVFERTSRGVRLTPAGHMLVQRSRALLDDADRLAVDLHDYSQGLQGHVRVLANASAILEVLAPRLEGFMREHPLIHIDLEERSSPEVPLPLLEGRADLGIVDLPHAPQGLELVDFCTDTLVLLVQQGHALAGRGAIALREALDQHFITLTDGTALSNRLLTSAAELGRPVHIRMRMRSFDAVCRMVAGGIGVGVLPLEAVAPQLAHLPIEAVPLTDPWARRTHRLATRAGVALSPAAKTLVEALRRAH